MVGKRRRVNKVQQTRDGVYGVVFMTTFWYLQIDNFGSFDSLSFVPIFNFLSFYYYSKQKRYQIVFKIGQKSVKNG